MSLFDRILTQPIFNLLAFIHNMVGDFGVAIIILTIFVRLLLWPLVKRQLHQNRVMREIQPELQKIRTKANGDKMLESTMMMELYKEKNVKPFSSMLILLIQIPIMIAIFRVIQIFSGADYNATNGTNPTDFIYPFLAEVGRIPDLLAGQSISLFGLDLTQSAFKYTPAMVLAVMAGLLQFYQTKQAMPDNKNSKKLKEIFKEAADGKEADQAEIMAATNRNMMLFTPLMTFVIMLSLPGAVVLYYATTSLIAILQQRYIFNKSEEEMEKLATKKHRLLRRNKAKATTREKSAQEAVVVRKKDMQPAKKSSSTSSGKTVVRRIKAK